ncbi:MAG: OsmC family protein, partial [Myxococcales bacterium]|nr:OsmC family protein [Myxococcales bacterium]
PVRMSDESKWSVRVTSDPKGAVGYVRTSRVPVGAPLSFDAEYPAVSALEQVLVAVAADLVQGLALLARRRRLAIDRLEAVIHGRLGNPLVYLGVVGESGDPGLASLACKIYVDTLEDEARVRSVFDESLRRSPLYNTFARAVRFEIELLFVP